MIEVTNVWDLTCNFCILILETLSHMTGLSYGFINIMIFVILGPLATLLFMSSALTLFINVKKRNTQKLIATLLFVAGIIAVLLIVIPIFIAFLEIPWY